VKTHRITIVLDADLRKKLLNIQAKEIKERQISYSFSKAINDTLRKVLS